MPKSSKRQKKKAYRRKRTQTDYIIFLSHSSHDSWIANVIAEKIQAIGADCWLDEKDLGAGGVIVDEIIRGIDSCEEAIVLISPSSVNSQWVSFEIGGVRAQHKRVTPILNNVKLSEMPPKALTLTSLTSFWHNWHVDLFKVEVKGKDSSVI